MIQCDVRSEQCYQWYHGDCVGITSEQGMMMERDNKLFVCPFCDKDATTLRGLPSFTPTVLSNLLWRNSSITDLHTLFDDLYSKIVHWRHNLFLIPTGASGKAFVSELAFLIQSFADGLAIEPFALKALMVMPGLRESLKLCFVRGWCYRIIYLLSLLTSIVMISISSVLL